MILVRGEDKGGNKMNSILTSVKKGIGGITEEDTTFDSDIIMHINTVFMELTQMGVGPAEGFSITDKNDEWSDFTDDDVQLESVKSYMILKVRLLFDPPASSVIVETMERQINRLEWRLNVAVDKGDTDANT